MGRANGPRGGRGWWVLALLAAAAAGAPMGGHAQPAPAAQRVEISGSAASERRDAVAGKQVVEAAEIVRYGDTRLTDALRRLPGVSVTGSGADLAIRLDGMAAEQTLVLLNGEPVPRAQVLEALAAGAVERIEIVRGAHVQWSGRGLAGTINIVTRRQAQRVTREMALSLGSHFGRPIGQAELTLGERQGAGSWRLGLSARGERERYPVQQHLSFRSADGELVSAYRNRILEAATDQAVTATPLWQWSGDEGRRLLAEAVLSASRLAGAGEDDRDELQGVSPRMQHDRLAYRHDRTFLRLRVEGAWPLAAATRVAGNLTTSRARRDQASRLTGNDVAGVAVRDSTVDSTRLDDLTSGRLALEHRLDATHTLSSGMQVEGNRGREDRLQRERIPSWEPDVVDERYDAVARSVALYAQDDWLPDRHTTWSLGVRVERLDMRSEGNVFDAVRQRHHLASPVLNGLWRPTPDVQWTFGLSRAFRLPEPRDIMPRRWTRPENSSLVPDAFGNPDLRPESAWTAQAGWERTLGGEVDLRLGWTALARRIDDVVLRELVLQDGRYLLRPVNQGRAWMVSLQGRAQAETPSPWGGPVSWKASATARDSRIDALPGPENRLPDASRWELQLDAEHRPSAVPLRDWAFSAGWRWRAATRAQAPSGRLTTRNPVRALDLAALWQAGPADRLRLAVTGLGAGDEVETSVRVAPDGRDELFSSTRRSPRWRVQWTHQL